MNLFVEVDLSQAEWVVTAYASRDTRMIEIVESGVDPHLETGHLISNAPRDYIKAEDEAIGHLTDPEEIKTIREKLFSDCSMVYNQENWFLPRVMSVRQGGKKSNHGLNYDMRYKRFSLENEIPETDGKKIVDLYHGVYKGLRNSYYPWIEMMLRKNRTLIDCFNNKRVFRKAWGVELLASAYAWIPQSTVGEIGKRAVTATYLDDHNHMRDVKIAANVHDSINTHMKYQSPAHLIFVANRLQEHMTQTCTYHNRAFKIGTDVKIGTNWGAMEAVDLTVRDPINEIRRALEVVRADTQVQ